MSRNGGQMADKKNRHPGEGWRTGLGDVVWLRSLFSIRRIHRNEGHGSEAAFRPLAYDVKIDAQRRALANLKAHVVGRRIIPLPPGDAADHKVDLGGNRRQCSGQPGLPVRQDFQRAFALEVYRDRSVTGFIQPLGEGIQKTGVAWNENRH